MEETRGVEKLPQDDADKWRFVAEQVMNLVKENYIKDPADITYQFSRKITDEILKTKYQSDNDLVKEGLAIGVYRGLENMMKKLFTRK